MRQDLWVRPETAATKIAPSTQPRMARPANTRRCNRVRPKRSGLSQIYTHVLDERMKAMVRDLHPLIGE
ncbi:MAG: hypothetical protein WA231_06800 [Methylocella sp.]